MRLLKSIILNLSLIGLIFTQVTFDVTYVSDADIGGFQFNITEGSIVSATGGDATAAGFTISASGTTVLGFSFTGGVIPAGEGTLLTLEVEGATESCITGLVLSDAAGGGLDAEVDCTSFATVVVVDGCTDQAACNYNADATDDDGACTFAEVNFDCDGNCTVDTDCNGDCGGDAVVDGCDICGGDGTSCLSTSFDITYVSGTDIGGFQFNITEGSIVSATGGDATAAGFTISARGKTVLGFSYTAVVITAGEGT
jgi:hypothetical protein